MKKRVLLMCLIACASWAQPGPGGVVVHPGGAHLGGGPVCLPPMLRANPVSFSPDGIEGNPAGERVRTLPDHRFGHIDADAFSGRPNAGVLSSAARRLAGVLAHLTPRDLQEFLQGNPVAGMVDATSADGRPLHPIDSEIEQVFRDLGDSSSSTMSTIVKLPLKWGETGVVWTNYLEVLQKQPMKVELDLTSIPPERHFEVMILARVFNIGSKSGAQLVFPGRVLPVFDENNVAHRSALERLAHISTYRGVRVRFKNPILQGYFYMLCRGRVEQSKL